MIISKFLVLTVVCVNNDYIKYIELENKMGDDIIYKLFVKFYYEYCEFQSILSITAYASSKIKFMLITH